MSLFSRAALGAALLAASAAPTLAQHDHSGWTSHRADGHAPIGVMGDHTHGAGEAMLSVRTMHMGMAGSRVGTDGVEDAQVVAPDGQNFLVTPVEMPMTMTMVGAMVAPTDYLTLMAMVPYTSMTMDHLTRMGGAFTTESSGLGDVSATALVRLARFGDSQVHAGVGVSFPTGAVDQRDDTPMGEDQVLPYPMQTGSGTADLKPSLTYLGQSERVGWGAQARGTVRLGTNSRDFAYGNTGGLTAWGSVLVTPAVSVSARLDGQAWGDVTDEGGNYAMGVMNRVVPTVFADLRAGERVDASIGANVLLERLGGLRLAAEAGLPVYQRLDGPQLETDFTVTVGAQFAFGLF